MVAKKVGRPTDSLKDYMLRTRLDKETVERLDYLAENFKVSRSEIIRRGIEEQYQEIKKE